jgi:D-glucosaminate-6-phosphate ammonia-lyase
MTKSIAEELGVVPIINAGGPNTKHSGSRPRPETLAAMREVSSSFVQMEEMLIAAGEEIARLTGVEAATVTSGASGGLVVQAAAAIARDDPELIASLPVIDGIPNELIIQRGHRFVYDYLYLGVGARLVEVGTAEGCALDEVIGAISEKTAGVIHLESPFKNRGAVPLPDLADAVHERGLPVLCDAASMLPPRANLSKFVNQGADLVSFSGGKGIRGPQSTGVLLGNAKWVEYARLNNAPYATAARGQKVSREEIAGIIAALRVFVDEDEDAETLKYRRQMEFVVDQIAEVPGVRAVVEHNYDHYIPHAVIYFTSRWMGPDRETIREILMAGSPRVFVSPTFGPDTGIQIDALNIQEGELSIVAECVRRTLIDNSSG